MTHFRCHVALAARDWLRSNAHQTLKDAIDVESYDAGVHTGGVRWFSHWVTRVKILTPASKNLMPPCLCEPP